MDAVVRVWEVGSWKELVAFKTTGKSVRSLMFSPNARILVAEGDDGTVIIWNALTRKEESRIRLESPLAVGNDRIVACPDKHMVKWIDVAAKRFQSKKLVEGSNNGARPVSQLAVSPDGKTLAAGEWKGRVRIWDLSSGKERNTLVEPGLMSYLGFNLDGTLLACCTSRSLRVWWVRDE